MHTLDILNLRFPKTKAVQRTLLQICPLTNRQHRSSSVGMGCVYSIIEHGTWTLKARAQASEERGVSTLRRGRII